MSRVQIGGTGGRRNIRLSRMQQRTVLFSDVPWRWCGDGSGTFRRWRQRVPDSRCSNTESLGLKVHVWPRKKFLSHTLLAHSAVISRLGKAWNTKCQALYFGNTSGGPWQLLTGLSQLPLMMASSSMLLGRYGMGSICALVALFFQVFFLSFLWLGFGLESVSVCKLGLEWVVGS